MKILVQTTIEVDPEEWRAEYGNRAESLAEIREAVAGMAKEAVRAAFTHLPVKIDGEMGDERRRLLSL